MTSLDIKLLDGTAPHGHGVVWMNVPYGESSGQTLNLQIIWPPIEDWPAVPGPATEQSAWHGYPSGSWCRRPPAATMSA